MGFVRAGLAIVVGLLGFFLWIVPFVGGSEMNPAASPLGVVLNVVIAIAIIGGLVNLILKEKYAWATLLGVLLLILVSANADRAGASLVYSMVHRIPEATTEVEHALVPDVTPSPSPSPEATVSPVGMITPSPEETAVSLATPVPPTPTLEPTVTPEVTTTVASLVPTEEEVQEAVEETLEFFGGVFTETQTVTTTGTLFLSPVQATDTFNDASSWIIAEPGVILTDTKTADRGSAIVYERDANGNVILDENGEGNNIVDHGIQCPEGGFAYASLGYGTVYLPNMKLTLVGAVGRNHIVLVRCRIDDARQDTDLNFNVVLSGYKEANIWTSPMPAGAYVSKGWFRQQLVTSMGGETVQVESGGNCGRSGCSDTWVHIYDYPTGTYYQFVIDKGDPDNWTQIYPPLN